MIVSRVPASNKAFSGILLAYFESPRGHWGAHGCPRGVQGGSGVPLYRILNPSQSLIWHKIWFQTSHDGPNSQFTQGWTNHLDFRPLGPSQVPQNVIVGANQTILGQQKFPRYPHLGSLMPYISGKHPDGAFLISKAKNSSTLGPLMVILGVYGIKRPVSGSFKCSICSKSTIFRALRIAFMVQK